MANSSTLSNPSHSPTIATLAGGCFWCLESAYAQLRGVTQVLSGYMGGKIPHPTYEAVCTGTTEHAEVVQIQYHEEIITYRQLLEIFFTLHDPTTLNRQGNDTGTQYRSAIFFHSPQQQQLALAIIAEMQESKVWEQPIVTLVEPAQIFYEAEAYHQGYYVRSPMQPYCQVIISPKLRHFRQQFKRFLRPST